VLSCTRNDYFLQKVRSRLRETILFETWSLLGRPWGGPGDRDGHALAAPCQAETGMATHRPMLPCTRNDDFLQKVRSRLRKTTKTITFRHWPSQGEPLKNRAGSSLELTRAGQPTKILPPVHAKHSLFLTSWDFMPRGLGKDIVSCTRNGTFWANLLFHLHETHTCKTPEPGTLALSNLTKSV
jgi:hypothetical protein